VDFINIILIVTTILYSVVALCFFSGLFRSNIPPQTRPKPFISVVIAARDEADYITQCLTGFTQQTYPSTHFEVLVVNDESTDQTAQLVETIAQKHTHIHLLNVDQQYPHMAAKKRPMSVGIHHAKGEWIVTTDADCQVPPTWLGNLAAYMQTDTDVIIGFSQIKTQQDSLSLFEKLQGCDFLSLMSAAAGSANWGYPLAATGQNFSYRKDLFERVGGFASVSHRPSGDDVLLLQLFRQDTPDKMVFASDPKTFVSTHRPETPRSFWRQRKRWASNAAFQIRLNPVFFVYILVVFGSHALIPISLLMQPQSYLIPLTCWLVKALTDWLVISKGAQTFERTDLLWVWPIWEILQPIYILFIGLTGTLGGITWKDRHHPQ
jgi:poly-beta-1,6-N-acetyl-D-glucosamine synthase